MRANESLVPFGFDIYIDDRVYCVISNASVAASQACDGSRLENPDKAVKRCTSMPFPEKQKLCYYENMV